MNTRGFSFSYIQFYHFLIQRDVCIYSLAQCHQSGMDHFPVQTRPIHKKGESSIGVSCPVYTSPGGTSVSGTASILSDGGDLGGNVGISVHIPLP